MDNNPSDKGIKVYQKSDVIFEENSRGDEMYIVRSGKVKLVLGGTRGGAEVRTLEQLLQKNGTSYGGRPHI